jgi:hypothetical protein
VSAAAPTIRVNDLAVAILPAYSRVRLMVMLACYFDASTGPGSDALSVAGYVAPVDQWGRFQREWKEWLDEFGVIHFHMTDWESKWGEFRGWTDDKKHRLFQKLVGTLRLRFHLGVSAAVIVSDYHAVRPLITSPEDREMSAYTFCAIQCFHRIEVWADKHRYHDPIAYILEGGDNHDGEIYALESLIRKSEARKRRFRYGSLTFADKRQLNPLQAADILAYETWKEMENFVLPGARIRQPRHSARILLTGHEHRYSHGYYNKESLLASASVNR